MFLSESLPDVQEVNTVDLFVGHETLQNDLTEDYIIKPHLNVQEKQTYVNDEDIKIEPVPSKTNEVTEANNTPFIGKLFEAENYLKSNYDFQYNMITYKVELRKKGEHQYKKINDFEFNNLLRNMANSNISCDGGKLRYILNSDFSRKYDPFKDYIDSLPLWDGNTDFIVALANTVNVENKELWIKCFTKWFVAMVASMYNEKIVNHSGLFLTGKQGIGKTTWFIRIVPKVLQDYIHCGSLNPTDKDSYLQLSECLLINLDEMGTMKDSTLNPLKELMTKSIIRVRRAYGHFHENYIRRASFCGSANEKQFLTDTTGNRRFLCFEVEGIDYQHDVNVDMAYAQAFHLYKNGFKFHFDQADIAEIKSYTDDFRLISMEEEALPIHFQPVSADIATTFLTTTEIHNYLVRTEGLLKTHSSIQRLGKALNKLAFTRKKMNGRQKWAVTVALP